MTITRRKVLGLSGSVAATVLAGCSSNSIPDDAVQSLPAPSHGSETAPVTVELFEDYGCPHCRSFNENILPRLVSHHADSGQAKIEFHDFPIPVRDFSWPAAMAARSVQERGGEDAFWTYNKYVYKNQSQLGWALLREAANELGLDGPGVVDDARENKYRPVVQNDRDYGTGLGVNGTPTVFVGGELIAAPNGGTYNDYYRAISHAIEKHQ